MRHAHFVFQRLLDQLKRCSKRKYFLDRSARSYLHIIVGSFGDLATGRQISKTGRHMAESLVRLQETPGSRIDKSNAARHVRQDLFVKNDFPRDALRGLCLAAVEFACAQCGQGGADEQPADKNVHLVQQIMHGFVGDRRWLFDYSHPAGRFDWAEGINIASHLEMPALAFADLFHQKLTLGRNNPGVRLKVLCKNGAATLIEHLADGLIGELDRRQTSPDSFH